jgi:hypothetical protein
VDLFSYPAGSNDCQRRVLMTVTLELLPQFDRKRHGSLYDRGSADSYYHRDPSPHWYPEGSYHGDRMAAHSDEEIAEYLAGYRDNEANGDKKDWS